MSNEFDLFTFFKYNELQLRKAIDDYWASKRKTYAKGRIKRMRNGESKANGILRRIHGNSIVIPRNHPDMYEQMLLHITRWNKH